MKTFILDGNNFADIESFYNEIDKLLTKNLKWKTGHNLNAFNDLLRGGFGVHEYNEPIIIRWINFDKLSSIVLAECLYNIIKKGYMKSKNQNCFKNFLTMVNFYLTGA